MASLKETRDFLLLSYDQGTISIEEFAVLYESSNLNLPYESYSPFDLDDMENSECVAEFRVKKRHIPVLAEALQIPPSFTCNQRSKADGIEALCMLLKRFAYPCRYGDVMPRFARSVPVLSMVTNEVLNYIYDVHGPRITGWNDFI